ncbi:MAG: hypothetical protein C4345_11905, partial [Chloroflexota bacterium]
MQVSPAAATVADLSPGTDRQECLREGRTWRSAGALRREASITMVNDHAGLESSEQMSPGDPH